MNKKYEITNIQYPSNLKLYRIRALRDIPLHDVKAGDLGGYIESEKNLSQEDDCWIGSYALIADHACVFGNALVYGDTQIYGNARISGNAQVYDNALVYGYARISGNAQVYGDARISGNPWVCGDVEINDKMKISSGFGCIKSNSQIYYADGMTAYRKHKGGLVFDGLTPENEHHRTLAILRLS